MATVLGEHSRSGFGLVGVPGRWVVARGCVVGVLLAVAQIVCATPAGAATFGTAYVVNSGSDSVTPINIATNTAGAAIAVGDEPFGVAISPDAKTAYVANFGSAR